MKKILVGILLSLSLVGCGEVDVKEVREIIQDQNLPKKERREAINEYLEEKVDENADMVEKYFEEEITESEFVEYFMEQREMCELYTSNIVDNRNLYESEIMWYNMYGYQCSSMVYGMDELSRIDYEGELSLLDSYYEYAISK
jgi:hypothetical protein